MNGAIVKNLSSWGRLGSHPHRVVSLATPELARSQVADASMPGLPRGFGRSYGDVCLNPDRVIFDAKALDHLCAFDECTGALTCEAGVTLGSIQKIFSPRGWMLPVSPGTQYVTVGGAIANDVHGKNHHTQGTFGHHVEAFTLVRSDGSSLDCSGTAHPDMFKSTIGGLGLTGVITKATIRLRRVLGPWFAIEARAFDSLEGFFSLADASETSWEQTVAWIDCLSRGPRGVFFRGNATALDRASPKAPRARNLAIEPPFPLIGGLTLRLFNPVYYVAQLAKRQRVEHYGTFLYPLDHVNNWNRAYGPKGFYQYQCVVPHRERFHAMKALLREISRSGQGSFLAVLKTFGFRPPAGFLSFPIHGATLALDFANAGNDTLRLFERLDCIVAECGGRIYMAKDARMSRATFERGYAYLPQFLKHRDPGLSSAMSQRLLGS